MKHTTQASHCVNTREGHRKNEIYKKETAILMTNNHTRLPIINEFIFIRGANVVERRVRYRIVLF